MNCKMSIENVIVIVMNEKQERENSLDIWYYENTTIFVVIVGDLLYNNTYIRRNGMR